jgi:hypothetical protein
MIKKFENVQIGDIVIDYYDTVQSVSGVVIGKGVGKSGYMELAKIAVGLGWNKIVESYSDEISMLDELNFVAVKYNNVDSKGDILVYGDETNLDSVICLVNENK